MSRWREMVMDFGQIFGSDKSGRGSFSSNAFTINEDLKDKRNADLNLRRTLELHFRPLFQRFVYGGEKIACHDLRRILQDPTYRDRLPPDKIQELVDVADFNRGKAISYNEFVNIILNQLHLDDIASMGSLNDLSEVSRYRGPSLLQKAFPVVCRNIVPQKMVESKMGTYRCLPPPFFIILITIAQVVLQIVVNEIEDVTSEPLDGVAAGNALMYNPHRRREAWRWISYCLLHQGYVDLIFNVVIQVILGIPLEMVFSWWRVAVVYFAGVLVGCCGHSLTDHNVGLVGAAGGTYALLGAHVVAMVTNWKRLNDDFSESRTKRTFCSLSLRILVILLIVIPQLSLAVYRRFFMDNISMKIGIAANIGGLIAGAICSDSFLTDYKRSPMKAGAAVLTILILLFIFGVTIITNIVWFDYPTEDYS